MEKFLRKTVQSIVCRASYFGIRMCINLDINAILKYHKIQKLKDKHGK